MHNELPTVSRFLAIAIVVTAISAGPADALELRVGPADDPACDFQTIQEAIDEIAASTMPEGTVRIAFGTYTESLWIENASLVLSGGHIGCSDAIGAVTQVEAPTDFFGGRTVARVRVTSEASVLHTVHFRNMQLSNGRPFQFDGSASGGHGLIVEVAADRRVDVVLDETWVVDNHAQDFGGGVAVTGDGEAHVILHRGFLIDGNQALGDFAEGGGISCTGNHFVLLRGGQISNNTAGHEDGENSRGGGIFVDGCILHWFAHFQEGADWPTGGSLYRNETYGDGGGLHARGGARVRIVGAHDSVVPMSSRPAHIAFNQTWRPSDDPIPGPAKGGAIYARDAGTEVTVDRSWVYSNFSEGNGGGAFVEAGATVTFKRGNEVCHQRRDCSLFHDNAALSTGAAGMAVGSGTQLNFQRTRIFDNIQLGTQPLFNVVHGATLQFHHSLIHGEAGLADHTVVVFGIGTRLLMFGSTLADIKPSSSVIRTGGEDVELAISHSIVHDPDIEMHRSSLGANPPKVISHCVIWHSDQLASQPDAEVTQAQVADPLFADRGKDVYYLQPESPAINYCDFPPLGTLRDLDWNPRGTCHSTTEPCNDRVFDIGAYEFPIVVFRDRFEN